VLTACLDTLVSFRERRAQSTTTLLANHFDDDHDDNNKNNDRRRVATALSQLAAVVLMRAHHSSYLAPDDAGARRLARLGAQVRGGQYPPLAVLGTVRRLAASLERSADMFDLIDQLRGALRLWCGEARPDARTLTGHVAAVGAPPPVLDSDTCERLKLTALELWSGVLASVRHCYRGAYDAAMLVRVAPLLALGFGSRHREFRDATCEFWSATFAHAISLAYPIELMELLAPLRDVVVLPGFPEAEFSSSSVPVEPVTRFHSIAKRRTDSSSAAAATTASVKRSRTVATTEEQYEFVDKTNNIIQQVAPPERSTQVHDDNSDRLVELVEQDLLDIEQRIDNASLHQLTRIQWLLSRTNFRISTNLKNKLNL
jgi:hypothetical protein